MSDLPFASASAGRVVPIDALPASGWAAYAEGLSAQAQGFAKAVGFAAQAARYLSIPGQDGALDRIVFGVAEAPSPMAFGALASALPDGLYELRQLPASVPAELAVLAWALGAYRFTAYKPRRGAPARLVAPTNVDLDEAARIARAVYLVRDLVNTPAEDMNPVALQAAAEQVATQNGAEFEVIEGEALLAQNYPLIHAVGRAAAHAPRFVRLAWGDQSAPKLTLVGKGVTFDSGGLDIKPSAGMRIMKKDMGGAAHALALGQLVMQARLPVRLQVMLPIVENAVSGAAMRPGDVFKSRKGLTVEIDNTDAEGRLILADALARASEDDPDLILDFATLTGAARTALGPDLPPLFTDDDQLADDLAAAARAVSDPLWRLPLWPAYDADMDSPIADLKNTGDGAFAGAIYGGLFLKRFVAAKSWAHFDVFAWAPKDKPSRPQGGEAHALRACWRVLRQRYPSTPSHNI